MNNIILLSGAGIIGTLLRYVVASVLFSKVDTAFPWGTFCINMCGALLMGFLVESFYFFDMSNQAKLVLAFGFLGAFTTYSAYAWEVVTLFRSGFMMLGVMYVFLTNVVSCTLLGMGIVFARWIFGR